MSELWRKLRFLFQRRRFESELEQELRFHFEMPAQEHAVRRAFGSFERMKEGSREMQFMRHLIWGVSPTDAWTFAGAPCLFLLMALAASLLPASRITRLNPANTLRNE
jgi:ABC-type lipoprotein release transport system permease subunit